MQLVVYKKVLNLWRMIRALFNTVYYLLFAAIVSLAVLLVASFFPFDNWYQVKVVLSGSMEPSIQVGSVVVIKPESQYKVGDVITFGPDTKTEIPVTHRVTEIVSESRASQVFITKGDANEDPDPNTVSSRNVIGKVAFSLPYVGYLLEFAKTPMGFVSLVVVPGILIALGELLKIVREFWRIRCERKSSVVNNIQV